MFRENTDYQQGDLFGVEYQMTDKQKKYFERSTEFTFFTEIFHRINESDFSHLYSSTKSRPNVPVNQLVGALIMKHLNDWTYVELFNNLTFNTLTRYAIGITNPRQDIFSEASIFNFQNRLIDHFYKTGEDLINNVFVSITKKQLEKYKVHTTVQRGDSFLVDSKVIEYSRLRLFIEVLKRLQRSLSDADQQSIKEHINIYDDQTSGHYVYTIRKQEIIPHYEQIAQVYYTIYHILGDKYKEVETYQTFLRVYKEYFKQSGDHDKIEIRPTSELHSSKINSPDDTEATFSAKYGSAHIGYSTHISETRHPDNNIELITDVVVANNNVSDDKILETRIKEMKERMPEWSEYFVDGAYGNENVDKLNKAYGITQYQSGVKGRRSFSNIRIHKSGKELWVSCGGGQKVSAQKTTKMYCAKFDNSICETCPFKNKCRAKKSGGKFVKATRLFYFRDKNILAHQRMMQMDQLPQERRNIRSNVEATVKEMKRGMKNGKVRIRHRIRVSMHMNFTAISVNLRRIHLKSIEIYQIWILFWLYDSQSLRQVKTKH